MDKETAIDMAVAQALECLRVDYEISIADKCQRDIAELVLEIDMPTCVAAVRMSENGSYDEAIDMVEASLARVLKRGIDASAVDAVEASTDERPSAEIIYSHRAAFVAKVETQITRYRNIALGYRYGGRREDEEAAIATGIKLCAIIGEAPRKPARLKTKGLAV